jgi:hypothetical protein
MTSMEEQKSDELLEDLDRMIAVYDKIGKDGLRQQKVIELLTARHALRMQNRKEALMIADGVHRHVRDLIKQASKQKQKVAA